MNATNLLSQIYTDMNIANYENGENHSTLQKSLNHILFWFVMTLQLF